MVTSLLRLERAHRIGRCLRRAGRCHVPRHAPRHAAQAGRRARMRWAVGAGRSARCSLRMGHACSTPSRSRAARRRTSRSLSSATGTPSYKEAADDDQPLKFQLARERHQSRSSGWPRSSNGFTRPLEAPVKVAFMGMKTFRFENGAEKNEVKFNFSLKISTRSLLQDWFERIAETEQHVINLERAAKYDKLGVNRALLLVQVIIRAQAAGSAAAIAAHARPDRQERHLYAHGPGTRRRPRGRHPRVQMKLWAFLLLVACVVSAQQPANDAEEKELSSALAEAGIEPDRLRARPRESPGQISQFSQEAGDRTRPREVRHRTQRRPAHHPLRRARARSRDRRSPDSRPRDARAARDR